MTPKKICNKWSTRQDGTEENGFQEQNYSFTLSEIHCALYGWDTLQAGHQEQTNLLVSEPHDGGGRHDEHQIGLSNLFHATPLNPYLSPISQEIIYFIELFYYGTKLIPFCLLWLWFLDNIMMSIHSHITLRKKFSFSLLPIYNFSTILYCLASFIPFVK